MPVDRTALKSAYAILKGLDKVNVRGWEPREIGDDFEAAITSVEGALGEKMPRLHLPNSAYSENRQRIDSDIVRLKLCQTLSFLEVIHNLSQELIEIGTLFNSIQDEELRNRCADLLSARDHFDRAINQATLVLEDRIRRKSNNKDGLTGTPLVNKVLNTDLSKTVLKLSNDEGEHEGFCHIIRGIMGAFRNETHHHVTERFSREDALKVCSFIDNILKIISNSEVVRT
ncbi:MAG: hypothetical protein DI628_03850 [Blastochloris viridis]|uniref:Conserved hypothetical protein CHP02391 domain-containing protein n=1 Tax=Blastochloris viridis TaxID=1079 RepID=A0A6N4RCL5_BLAVI|nr:MAG: hypothetical protein DI628_03850 [Blastochloris viridis]